MAERSRDRKVTWPKGHMAEMSHGRKVTWPKGHMAERSHGRKVTWPRLRRRTPRADDGRKGLMHDRSTLPPPKRLHQSCASPAQGSRASPAQGS
eukprot:1088330-Prymnesium_polylepis.1